MELVSINRMFPQIELFSINIIISIDRIFQSIELTLFHHILKKNKIQKNRQPYSLMPGPSMAVRPPQEQPLQYRIDRILIIIRNISIVPICIIYFYIYINVTT